MKITIIKDDLLKALELVDEDYIQLEIKDFDYDLYGLLFNHLSIIGIADESKEYMPILGIV
ncbi:MAG: hypothetical protein M0Q14_01885 [Tissierellaceae bacterium]|nr:hypothetical protein [Tissierellaceae bacterium]